MEATELSPSGEPAPAAGSIAGPTHLSLRRVWFPLQSVFYRHPGSDQKSAPWGGCHFHTPGTGMSPRLPASQARQRSSGEVPGTFASLGPVFSLDPCGSYFSAIGLPVYPLASPLSLPLASDGKRSEGWVVHNIELSQGRAPLTTVEER